MRLRNGRTRRIACALGMTAIAAGSAAASGSASTGVPVSQSPPTIAAGVPVVGQPLQASHGAWTGSPTSYEDWWIRCNPHCVIIPGADGLQYTPTAADAGGVLEFGEMATNDAGQSKPAFSTFTQTVLATPPIRFTLVGPTGIPQFAYYLVEPAGRKPTPHDWALDQNVSVTVGEVDADVKPGETIYFSPTGVVNQPWWNGIRHTLTPEGITGKPFHVTASTPMRVRVVLPSPGKPYHPGLSKGELYVLGQLNRKRLRLHEQPLVVSTILDDVASLAARDEAVHHRWPDPYFFSFAGAFGWPGDLTRSGFSLSDAPLTQPAQVLAHWDGAYGGESAGIWHNISAPYYKYVGIADGGGAWNIVTVTDCADTVDPVRTCGLTHITGL